MLPLIICHPIHIEVTGDVIEALNVILLACTTICVLKAILEVEWGNGLAIQRHLHTGHLGSEWSE